MVNYVNVYGSTPLMCAVKMGHKTCTEKLIEAGADVNSGCLSGKFTFIACSREW